MSGPPVVLGLGVTPEVVAGFAARHSLRAEDRGKGIPFAPVIVLLAGVDDERLGQAAERGFHACYEILDADQEDQGVALRLLPTLTQGGLYLSLSTAAAHTTNVARHFRRRLEAWLDLPMIIAADIEMALHEAVSNAVVHGNLEIPLSMPGKQDGLSGYARLIEERLAEARFAARRVEVAARSEDHAVHIAVQDQGPGYGARSSFGSTLTGHGLQLIHGIARSVSVGEGGRRITMEFAR